MAKTSRRTYVARGEVDRGEFDALEEASKSYGEYNDCAVKAISVVCGVTYAEAHAALEKLGRKRGGATGFELLFEAVRCFGKKVVGQKYGNLSVFKTDLLREGISFESRMLAKLETEFNYKVKNLTTRQLSMFPGLLESESGTHLVFTRGHVVAVKDGKIHCWASSNALRIYETVEIL